MSLDSIAIEIPREAIEQIAREVVEQSLSKQRPAISDEEAEVITRKLQQINAKQIITIPEFCFLFNCSTGYVGKLLERAQTNNTSHPVPYLDLDGLVQFDRVEVLAWAAKAKPLVKNARKTGGRKQQRYPRPVAKHG